jgi:hypothetical protein
MSSIAESPHILHHPQFQATVEALAQKAHTALPLANGRIEKAVDIVLSSGVTLHSHGHAVVQSQSRPHTSYSVNGTCGCPDMADAPGQWCKHRIATALLKRTQEALARLPLPVTDLPPIEGAPSIRHRPPLHHLPAWTLVREVCRAARQSPRGRPGEAGRVHRVPQ